MIFTVLHLIFMMMMMILIVMMIVSRWCALRCT